MTNYFLTIADEANDTYVAHTYGDFAVVNFAAKQAYKVIDGKPGDFSARLVEVERIGEPDEKRVVCSVSGDAETVTVVLKKKISVERKAQAPAESVEATETDAE